MLSPESAAVVKATLPTVGAAIEEITTRFYATLFADHPALERDLFNRGNQAQGDQQRALAGAIASFASILVADDGPPPDKVLSRIANKHASLGITADQYQVVHDYLFAAIIDVLGAVITAEVATAWESPDCISLVLGGLDVPLPQSRPGQYTSVMVVLPDGARQTRQYSITSDTRDSSTWRVTIKRVTGADDEPAGEVSNFIHDKVFEDFELTVSRPFGDLTLADDPVPVLLVSAGIGCTPMIGMLRHLVDTSDQRVVSVVHADRSPSVQAHRSELVELVGRLPTAIMRTWYTELGVALDLSEVDLPDGVQVYLCGPLPFMRSMREQLVALGISPTSIHYEVFGPDLWLQVA